MKAERALKLPRPLGSVAWPYPSLVGSIAKKLHSLYKGEVFYF
jgi:hypothetical protein